jgi:hypothetical protein
MNEHQITGVAAIKRLNNWLGIIFVALFLLVISAITTSEYLRLPGGGSPSSVLTGNSLAPGQYRLLTPFVCFLIDKMLNNPILSYRTTLYLSILFSFTVCFVLFFQEVVRLGFKAKEALGLSMILSLALLGCFQSGFLLQYCQEFWETGFLVLCFIVVDRDCPNYFVLVMITLLGSLNRETWIFTIGACLIMRVFYNGSILNFIKNKSDLLGMLACLVTYFLIFFLARWFYGLKPYFCDFWLFKSNLLMFMPHVFCIWTLGTGLFLIWILSVVFGNRDKIYFIIGYLLPFLTISFFIASWYEHRIFFAVYPILLSASFNYFIGDKKGSSRKYVPA